MLVKLLNSLFTFVGERMFSRVIGAIVKSGVRGLSSILRGFVEGVRNSVSAIIG